MHIVVSKPGAVSNYNLIIVSALKAKGPPFQVALLSGFAALLKQLFRQAQ
jgi:hypothetical protein